MAALRDFITGQNKNCEHNILPLNYLLEMMNKLYIRDNVWHLSNMISENAEDVYKIVYIDDITEQDYNGTFSDTIYIVKLNDKAKSGKLILDVNQSNIYATDVYSEKLYGWDNYKDFTFIESLNPIYDTIENGNYKYKINSYVTGIKFLTEERNEMTFNVIIPLYDMVDINYKTNFNNIDDEYIDGVKGISLVDSVENNLYIKNVPLGMWFADENITLKKDIKSNTSQTWSLTISSQFKPFPYSIHMPDETSSSGISNAYSTFAEILSKQNEVIDKFNELTNLINSMDKRLTTVENRINNISTIHNVNKLHSEIIKVEQTVDDKIESIKEEILDLMSNMKWKSTI
jgi:hypothetical protein